MKIFSGNSNLNLANKIAKHVGIPLGDVELKQFSDGELHIAFNENIRGEDVFLIQSIFPFFELTFIDCLFILVASSFIQMIPTGFGGLGIFHLGVESVLFKLGVENYYHFIILLWLYSYFLELNQNYHLF